VGGVAEKHVDFAYDLAGQLDTITRYSDASNSSGSWQGVGGSEVAVSEYVFDQAGRLDTLKHHQGATTGGTLLAGYDFDFTKRNHLATIDFLPPQYNAEDVSYSYDDRGQLEGADQSGTTNDESYTYDENGNRVTANGSTYATGDDNRLASDGTYTYEYDNEGNRVKRTEIATGEYTEYKWDHRNRLVKVTEYNASDVATQAVDHAYDAENQWIRRTVDPDGDTGSDPVEQTVFVHDDNQLVMQFDDTGSADLTKDDLSHRYLWGAAVDQLLADEEVNSLTNANLNETLWALTDHLGSVRDLVDDSGAVQNHKSYDAYGNVTAETNAAVDTIFGFTGKALDESTGLQNNWNRWYDASVGRWLSQDPIGFEAGDANVYPSCSKSLSIRRSSPGSLSFNFNGQ